MIVGGVAGFIAVTADLLCKGQLQRWDWPIHVYFHEHASPALMWLFSAISGLGELYVILAVALAVGWKLWRFKRWRSLIVWAIALAGSGIINPVLKNIFRVPRPGEYLFWVFKENSGYSFPSGHTMAVSIAAGALALVLARELKWPAARRWTAAAAVAGISLLEAFALLYVGVHYLTDVLGALAVSAAWLGAVRLMLPPTDFNGR